jgi:predicted nucleic acid-binding protein
VIAVDSNLLVYAHRRDSPFHEAAGDAIRGLAESPAPWAIPWPCIHEFLAIVAAVCLHHGVRELWSADRDFSRFPELRVRNPLVESRE